MAMAELRSMAELREMYQTPELICIYPTPAATASRAICIYPTPAATASRAAEAAANTAAGAVRKAMGRLVKKADVMASDAASEAAYAVASFREGSVLDPFASATYEFTLSMYQAAYEAACGGAYEAAYRGVYKTAYLAAYKVASTAAEIKEAEGPRDIKAEEEAAAALGIKAEEEAEAALKLKAEEAAAALKLKAEEAAAALKLKPSKAEAALKLKLQPASKSNVEAACKVKLQPASKSNVEVASAGGSGCKVPAALGSKAPLLERVNDDYIISLMQQKVARPRHLFASWGPCRSTNPEVMLAYERARAVINDKYSREDDIIRQYLQDGAAYVAVSSE